MVLKKSSYFLKKKKKKKKEEEKNFGHFVLSPPTSGESQGSGQIVNANKTDDTRKGLNDKLYSICH